MDVRLIEIMVTLGMVIISIVVLRNSQLKNLFELLIRGGGLLFTSIFFWLACQILGLLFDSWIFITSISALTTVIFGWQMVGWIRRREKDHRWIAKGEKWLNWPKALNGFLNVTFVFVMWFVVGIVAALAGELILIKPTGGQWLAPSWVWHHLIDSQSRLSAEATNSPNVENSRATNDADRMDRDRISAVQEAAAKQANFFQRFSSGVRETKQHVFAATGLDELQREIQLTRQVLNLSDEEKFWLLENHPQLIALVEHPVILKVVNDDDLIERFQRLADGHVEEVLMIGANSDIQILLNDPSIQRLIREIDLTQLLQQCESNQRASIQK